MRFLRFQENQVPRLAKEQEEELDISPVEARHRIIQGFEVEAKARGVTLEEGR
jgi:hypothetical protein